MEQEVKNLKKVIINGKVAVCYSPGFGAGWSTWASPEQRETLIFHPKIVQVVANGRQSIINEDWLKENLGENFGYVFCGGVDQLQIKWIPKGTLFRINEHDGSESVEVFRADNYIRA